MISAEAPPARKRVQTPFKLPEYSVSDLLGAIPKHCYERSAVKSFLYLGRDLCFVTILAYGASWIDQATSTAEWTAMDKNEKLSWDVARYALWAAYSFCQGIVMMGIWTVAHECGHQAFSTSKGLNNAVGWVLHSALLVPYHAWRISHAKHHKFTGHTDKDLVYVPKSKPTTVKEARPTTGMALDELFEDSPLYTLAFILFQQLLGFPLYLMTNIGGQSSHGWSNHFSTSGDSKNIFNGPKDAKYLFVSNVGLAIVFAILGVWGYNSGFNTVMKYYGFSYLWMNHWLICITYLQHTDPMVPHYRNDVWNFQRGSTATIDRKVLGPVGGIFIHGLAETHVAHHVCSAIPHYHAWEATEALKKVMGPHYYFTNENMFVSLWKNVTLCKYVEEGESVVFYKDAQGNAARFVESSTTKTDLLEKKDAIIITEEEISDSSSEMGGSSSE